MCSEPGSGNDGRQRMSCTFPFHGRVPWRRGLGVPICKMDGLESHRGEQCPFLKAGFWDRPLLLDGVND